MKTKRKAPASVMAAATFSDGQTWQSPMAKLMLEEYAAACRLADAARKAEVNGDYDAINTHDIEIADTIKARIVATVQRAIDFMQREDARIAGASAAGAPGKRAGIADALLVAGRIIANGETVTASTLSRSWHTYPPSDTALKSYLRAIREADADELDAITKGDAALKKSAAVIKSNRPPPRGRNAKAKK